MASSRKIEIVISGDSSDAQRAFRDVEKSTDGFGGKISKMGTVAAAGFAAAGAAVAFGAFKAVSAASDLNESMSKVGVVFGDNAGEILQWSETAATAMGQTRQQALESAGTFGNLFSALGVGTGPASDMSKSLVQLAGDIGSFNNVDPTEVLEALRSGLVGEAEPLRRFGVSINAARIEAEALRLGLAKAPVDMAKVQTAAVNLEKAHAKLAKAEKEHGKDSLEYRDAAAAVSRAQTGIDKAMAGSKVELTDAAKAQAAYALIMKDTKLAQGDFARTSDGMANKTRIVKAQIGDLTAKIGTALLPVATKGLAAVSDGLAGLGPVAQQAQVGFDAMFAAFQEGDVTSDGFVGAMERIGVAARGVVEWFRANWPAISATVSEVLTTVQTVVSGVVSVVTTLWNNFGNNILEFAQRAWGPIRQIVSGALEAVRGVIQVITSLIQGDWSGVWEGIKKTLAGALDFILGLVKLSFEQMRLIASIGLEILGSMFKKAWEGIKNAASSGWEGILGFIKGIPAQIVGLGLAFLGAGAALGGKIIEGIKNGLTAAGGFVGDIAGAFTDAFKSAWNGLVDLIASGFDALRSAINSKIPFSDPVPDLGGTVRDVLRLGAGGIVKARPGGTLALIAEAGRDEAVIPLPRGSRDASIPFTGRGGTVVNHYTTNINVTGTLNDHDTGRALERILAEHRRANGSFVWEKREAVA